MNVESETGARVMAQRLSLILIGVLLVVLYGFGGNTEEVETRGHSAIGWMISRWRDAGGDFSHAWAVPFLSLFLVWRQRRELRAAPRRVNLAGAVVILASIALYGLGVRGQQTRLCLLSLVGLLWGMPLYFYGWEIARRLLFPCAYLLFCLPLTFLDNITVPLRLAASTVSTVILNGLGIPTVRSGTAIRSLSGEGFNLEVADACSGLRSLLAMAALMAPYAYLTQKTMARKWALFLLCLPIAAVGNAVRIISVALVATALGQARATGFYHDYSGYLFFAVVVLLAAGAGQLMQRDFKAMVKRWKSTLSNRTS